MFIFRLRGVGRIVDADEQDFAGEIGERGGVLAALDLVDRDRRRRFRLEFDDDRRGRETQIYLSLVPRKRFVSRIKSDLST